MKNSIVLHLHSFSRIYPKAEINLILLITTKKYEQFTQNGRQKYVLFVDGSKIRRITKLSL